MKKQSEIQERLDELKADERLGYPSANVFINAPLALVQVELSAEVGALSWVLRDDQPADKQAEPATKDCYCANCNYVDRKEVFETHAGHFACPKCGTDDRLTECHSLKTLSEYFEKVMAGDKRFEIRVNDRNFQVNDYLNLTEIKEVQMDKKGNKLAYTPTGRNIVCKVTYMLQGVYGLPDDVCVMSIGVAAIINEHI